MSTKSDEISRLQKKLKSLAVRPKSAFWPVVDCLLEVHHAYPEELLKCARVAGIAKRKAYYLLTLGKTLTSARFSPNRLNKIGWTKLQIISNGLTSRNAAQRLKFAENSTAQQLKQIFAHPEPVSRPCCVLMYFSRSEYAIFSRAVLAHGGKKRGRGIAGKEQAVIKILRSVIP